MRTVMACALLGFSSPWFAWTSPIGAQPSILISPADLQRVKSDPKLVLLHVGPKEDYDAGHIEGARYVTLLELGVNDTINKLGLELPTEPKLREALERLGLSNNSKVVVTFGADWGSPSTRLMWTLQVAGLGGQSQLLDGGTLAWKRAGFPLTKTPAAVPAPGTLTLAQHREFRVDHTWIQTHANSPKTRLIDGRGAVFYEGPGMKMEGRPTEPAGHIAGAKNIPFNSLVDDNVQLLPLEALRKKFDEAGVQPGDTVAAYCHIGQQATTVLFAARMLGHPTLLYDGSMNDWTNRKLPLVNDRPGN